MAAIDRMRPAQANTCIAGTIGIHFSPKNILVKSGAKTNINPAMGNDKKAVSCKTLT